MGNMNDTSTGTSAGGGIALGQDTSCNEYTSGNAGTGPQGLVSASPHSITVLNGVASPFALTFPIPQIDGQVFEVLFITAIAALSCIAQAPAASIKYTPQAPPAGSFACWYYRMADATWYRKY